MKRNKPCIMFAFIYMVHNQFCLSFQRKNKKFQGKGRKSKIMWKWVLGHANC